MADRKNKWVQPRHEFIRNLVYPVLVPIILIKYGLKVDKFKNKGRQYFIMLNHQTPMDQFFVGISFSGAVYYVATEDIFSNGFTSRLIKWLIAPIPIKKQLTDFRAVKNCLQVAKEGGTIAIAPEG
ncbi:MAG: 1-acyl-sn-glycerol-3-phosphate acyltransferase, partial [Clostridia bacterium]|nr:1-acyl-sn-glycerol-3-phosphate acyltransferase [Clostridia bacterium]